MDFNINNYLSNLATINKDFNSIWEEILTTVPKITNNWKPGEANESDPLVVLLKELGIVSDKLNYNIDKNILENFPDLLTQVRTAYSVFNSMGYNPKWYVSALTNINIIYNGGIGEDILSSQIEPDTKDPTKKFTLNRFTQVSDENNENIYTLLKPVIFTPGIAESVSLPAIEGTINNVEINGNTQIKINNLDAQNRLYFVQPNVAQNGIFISFDENFDNINLNLSGSQLEDQNSSDQQLQGSNKVWKKVDNLYQYLPGSYIYKFGIDPSTGTNYIQFPDDIGTLIDKGIYIKYILSSGANGNIKANTITQLYVDPNKEVYYTPSLEENNTQENKSATITKANFSVHNLASTQNGSNPETIEEMQKNYEKVVGTFNTLVTLRDYNNYIYNATDSVGRNLVSNIKVSDRNNDLYAHLDYRALEGSGVSSLKTSILQDDMTAFDLRLYPLKNTNTGNINNYQDFAMTFNYSGTTSELAKKDDLWVTSIINSLEETKLVNHDFKEYCGAPIFADYDISGQIYLQKTVSTSEAAEIQQNVNNAIYNNFNSRNLNFGEGINYPKLVDIIKNADPRIQYAAINPIEYSIPKNSLDLFNSNDLGYDITSRTILNGSTPWAVIVENTSVDFPIPIATGFSGFTFNYNQKDITFYGIASDDSTSESASGKITKISPRVEKPTGDSGITVNKNETYSILTPAYVTKATYSNYFYVQLEGNEGFKLESGNPVELENNQKVNIYELRDSGKPKKTFGKGNIVVFNSSDSTISELTPSAENVRTNMGTKLSISLLELDETNLRNSRFLSNSNIDPNRYGLKIASNSQGLADYLLTAPPSKKGDGTDNDPGYTLNIGEYLLFTDYDLKSNDKSPIVEVGIIGEGNTIKNLTGNAILTDSDILSDKYVGNFMLSAADITSGNFENTPFVPIESNVLKYAANNIYNFGEGYKLRNIKKIDNYNPTQVFPIEVGDDGIEYAKENEESAFIPKPIDNKGYKMSCQLALLLTPGNPQKLEDGQTVEVTIKLNEAKDTTTKISPTGSLKNGYAWEDNNTLVVNKDNNLVESTYVGDFKAADGALVTVKGKILETLLLEITNNTSNIIKVIIKTDSTKGAIVAETSLIPINGTAPLYIPSSYVNKFAIYAENSDGASISGSNAKIIFSNIFYDTEITAIEGKEIQSNTTIIYNGGQPLELSESESNLLSLMSYSYGEDKEPTDSSIFWKTPIAGETVELPNLSSTDVAPIEYYLFAGLGGSNNVLYFIGKPGEQIETTKENDNDLFIINNEILTSISTKILGIIKGSYYYDFVSSKWTAISSLFNNKPDIVKLDSNQLYNKPYDPTYIREDNIIFNPLDANTFFLSNHPCNAYVLPRLIGKDGATPLKQLAISNLSVRR